MVDLKDVVNFAIEAKSKGDKNEYQKLISHTANELYEFYERDYNDFTNSALRSIGFCERQARSQNPDFWLDVKHYLKTNNY